ncbi:IS4 family transposase [Microbulbifer sp. SSSA008]|uniref:IS4 family transposase n=1 Tax=Microbulbifer sp. SSSA008 TaxID=3243380 RepID=UPI00403903AF
MRDINRMQVETGGFLGRRSGGEPGIKTVWQGHTKLLYYLEAAETLNRLKGAV